MTETQERRQHDRIRFSWPLWFGYADNGRLWRGQIQDLCRNGVSFTVPDHESPPLDAHIFVRFSYPNLTDEFEMFRYLHWAQVLRTQRLMNGFVQVALRLHEPLSVDPARGESKDQQSLSLTG